MINDVLDDPSSKAPSVTSRWIASGSNGPSLCYNRLDGAVLTGPAQKQCPIETGQSLLSGEGLDQLLLGNAEPARFGDVNVLHNDPFMVGWAQVAVTSPDMEDLSYQIYRSILEIVGTRSVYRFWNYVPGINLVSESLQENYQLFCSGRARGFADHFGDDPNNHYPSASATGTSSHLLTVVFLAGYREVRNWENPEQTPAYRYPEKYGRRPPAFARASQFVDPLGREWTFIAGTAAIKGCESQWAGEVERQLETTLDNLRLILEENRMRLSQAPDGYRRFFHVYLRDRRNLELVLKRLNGLLGPADHCTVVEADICRKDLEIEIEISVVPAS